MKTTTLLDKNSQGEKRFATGLFPRIIREFEDNDEPMVYGNDRF